MSGQGKADGVGLHSLVDIHRSVLHASARAESTESGNALEKLGLGCASVLEMHSIGGHLFSAQSVVQDTLFNDDVCFQLGESAGFSSVVQMSNKLYVLQMKKNVYRKKGYRTGFQAW